MAKDLNLSVTLKAVNKATGPLKKILQGSRGVGRAMKETREELRDFNDQQKRISAFRDMSRQSLETRDALREKRQELDRVSQELNNATGPTRRLTQQQAKAQAAVDKLNSEYRDQRDRVRELSRGLPRAEDGTRGLAQQQEQLARRAREATERLDRQRDAMRRLSDANVTGRFNKMTGEIGRLGRRTLFAAGAAAGGIFGIANSTATLGDDVAKTSAKIGISAQELQELRYAAERSGVSTQKLDSSTERFVKRLGEARQGGGAAAKAYEQLGLDANKLAELTPAQSLRVVADELAKVENHSDRVALAAQFFGREGVAMINMLKDGSAGLDQYARDARQVGFALGDDAAAGSEAFKDAMLDAGLSLQGMKNTIGAELMPAITDLMKEFSGWMRENREQVKAFARTFGERLKSAVPMILELARGAGTFAATLGNLTTKAAAAVGGFDNLAFVVAGLFAGKAMWSVLSFAAGVGKAIGALASFAMTFPKVAAGVKVLSAAFAATPIGWIIGGIALVAGAAYLIYRNWDAIGAWFGRRWQEVKDAVDGGLAGIGRLLANWNPVGLLFKAFTGMAERLGIDVPPLFNDLGTFVVDGLVLGVRNGFADLRAAISELATNVAAWFKGVLGIASPSKVFAGFGGDIVQGIINGIGGMVGTLRDQVVGLASDIAGWMKDAIGSAWDAGKEIANGIGEGAKAAAGAVKKGVGNAWQAGKDTARGMGEGIRDGFGNVWQRARELTVGTEDTVRDDLETRSPSRVFARIGYDVTAGLALGIQRNEDQPLREMGAFTRRLQQAGLALGAAAATTGAPAGQGAPLGMPAFDARPPLTAPASGGLTIQGGVNVSVQASPGMDEQALAQLVGAEVQRALASAERDANARRRSAFHDLD